MDWIQSVSDDRLTAITDLAELRELRDLYLQDWPKNCVGYYCLKNYIRWLQLQPDIKHVRILTLKQTDWRSNGLFLVVDRYQRFVNCLNESGNDLLLEAMTALDWAGSFKVNSYRQMHRECVVSIVESKNIKIDYDLLNLMFYQKREDVLRLQVTCPPGFYIGSLKEDDADMIDAAWPYNHPGSLFHIRRLLSWNVNAGVFVMGTDELVAWCLRCQGGFLAVLQVKDSHRRLGLGAVVAAAAAQRVAEVGDDVMASVSPTNIPSRRVFEKLGFKAIDNCYWLRSLPFKDSLYWPDGI